MNITQVKVFPVADSKVKANVSITLDDFVVTGFKIIEGSKGLFVSMPNRKNAAGEYKDTVYPITAEARTQLVDTILLEYSKQGGQTDGMYPVDSEDDLPFR